MTDEPRLIECPSCIGTRRGGLCRRCRTTGQIEEYGFYLPPVAYLLPFAWLMRLGRRWLGRDPDTGLPRDEP